MQKLKLAYLVWFDYYQKLPKLHRYSLGMRVDSLFIEIIEATSASAFLPSQNKLPYLQLAIRKTDTIKILLMILWETKSLEIKQFAVLSEKIAEIGRNLGAWHGSIIKANSPAPIVRTGEK